MSFSEEQLLSFLKRSDKSVSNATYNSRRHAKLSRYDEIEEFLKQIYPSAEIHFYGSRVIGNSNHYSDLDIYIDIGNRYIDGLNKKQQQFRLRELEKVMRKHPDWTVQIRLDEASCPVLRCFYIPKRLKCDVTFKNGLAVAYTDLLQHFFKIQPKAIKLFHCIRIWFNICDVKLRRHQLTIMFVFYLQHRGFLPPVISTHKGVKPIVIDNWNVAFNEKRTIEDYGCSRMGYFKKYLKGFFYFYSRFDFDSEVIFPYFGRSVQKQNYPQQQELRRFAGNLDDFKWQKPMAIAGCFGLGYNITYDIGKDRLKKFLIICQWSEELLDNNKF